MPYQTFRNDPSRIFIRAISFFLIFSLVILQDLSLAYWVWSPESGKFINPEGAVQDTPDEQYRYAISIYNEGDREQAIKELEGLLKHYPGAKIAPEVQLQLAAMLEEAQEFKKAFENYKSLLKNYPQFEKADEVIRREYDLGHIFLTGLRRKVMGVPVLPSVPLAVEVFQNIVDTAPFSAYGAQAQFNLGVALKKLGRFEEAIKAFQDLAEIYPQNELAADATFQAAQTQLLMSSTVNRDQQGLDEARKQFETFLADHPDAPEIEQAAALKRQAEEQYARKNYDIAHYYEERSYLDSAMIYYESVAHLYPDSEWGKKAIAQLEQLKDPVKYWQSQSEQTDRELAGLMVKLDDVTSQLARVPDEATTGEKHAQLEAERKELETAIKDLRNKGGDIQKAKREDIKRRSDLLERKKNELSSKKDALKRKKKKLKHVDSEDLKRAFKQWDEALKIEAGSLERERVRLERLADEVGIRTESLWLSVIPFVGGEELTEIVNYKKNEIEELDAQRAYLEDRRTQLADERESIRLQIETLEMRQLEILSQKEEFRDQWVTQDKTLEQKHRELESLRQEIIVLEGKAKILESQYKEAKGFSVGDILKVPVEAVSASVNLLNPLPYFGGDEDIYLEKLDAKEEHLKDKLRIKEDHLREINTALRIQEGETRKVEKSESATSASEKTLDRRGVRRAIRAIERDLRRVYQQIDDHRKIKNRKVDELEQLLKVAEKEVDKGPGITRSVTKPFKGAGRLVHAFVFGLEEKEQFVGEDASELEPMVASETQTKIATLQEEIQFENILIGAKRQELVELERKLRETKDQASEIGAPSFQSILLDQSYGWLKHTMAITAKMIPDQDIVKVLQERYEKEKAEQDEILSQISTIEEKRKDILAGQKRTEEVVPQEEVAGQQEEPGLKETEEAKLLKSLAGKTEKLIIEEPQVKSPPAAEQTAPEANQEKTTAIEKELQSVLTTIDERRRALETREYMYRKEIKSFYDAGVDEKLKEQFSHEEKALFTQDKDLEHKLKEVEKDLAGTIKDEHMLIQEERKLVIDRLRKITEATKDSERISDKQRKMIQDETVKLENHLQILEQVMPNLQKESKVLPAGKEAV